MMSQNILEKLYSTVESRKGEKQQGSYTCYLFEQGLNKILKKIGEESAETIIAAKDGESALLCGEVCDLFYHIIVMMVECGLPLSDVNDELVRRTQKIGNLKDKKKSDKNT